MQTERIEAADVAQIYKLWNEYTDAINSENMERWRALWSNDSIPLTPENNKLSGRDQIQTFTKVQSDQYHPKIIINPEVVRILGEHAYTYGSYKTILISRKNEDQSNIQKEGKFLSILEKQNDGSWKILVDCFNYNQAAEKSVFGSKLGKRGEGEKFLKKNMKVVDQLRYKGVK